MKIRKFLHLLVCTFLLSATFSQCSTPTAYTIYGQCFTDNSYSTPLANAQLDFLVSEYQNKGYAMTDANGYFAFFFWDDGNGNIQNTRKDSDIWDDGDENASANGEILFQPVIITYQGKVIFNKTVSPKHYTKENPLIIFVNDNQEGGTK